MQLSEKEIKEFKEGLIVLKTSIASFLENIDIFLAKIVEYERCTHCNVLVSISKLYWSPCKCWVCDLCVQTDKPCPKALEEIPEIKPEDEKDG